ncbi:hypothetical protein [Methanogenium cariaci]|uniref:hypothetical protein n=1 Tax=Methanogenium cariaci TaxID=2197 RepID=UPI0012F64F19|nr:hypothetical protein [Methanogenium cariaci]
MPEKERTTSISFPAMAWVSETSRIILKLSALAGNMIIPEIKTIEIASILKNPHHV